MKTSIISLALLCVVAQGCATAPRNSVAQAENPLKQSPTTASTGPTRQAIRTVQLETSTTEGQTTWRIQPESSWNRQVVLDDQQTPMQIKHRLRRAFDLAQRGAVHSAQAEMKSVLLMCAMEQDEAGSTLDHQQAMSQAFVALDEANDFYVQSLDRVGPASMAEIAASHQTKQYLPDFVDQCDAKSAVRTYYEFAEDRLAFACGSMSAASTALYGLGRLEPLLDSTNPNLSARSALYHRTALVVDSSNGLAANEFGCLLVRHGNLEAAESVFRQAIETGHGTASIHRNMAFVSSKLAASKPTPDPVADSSTTHGNLEYASLNVTPDETNLGLH